jgi:hypothetical protein
MSLSRELFSSAKRIFFDYSSIKIEILGHFHCKALICSRDMRITMRFQIEVQNRIVKTTLS